MMGAKMTENITPLRPNAKDPTGAQRQARFRKKRKSVVTVPSASPAPVVRATAPPALSGWVEGVAPVAAQRNGTAIDFAAYTIAVALAGAAAYFSIRGMTVLFPGAPTAIVGMAVAMEGSKLVTASWLARRWRATPWIWRGILVALVAGLALINAAEVYAQLVAAHVGERGAAISHLEAEASSFEAKIELAVHTVADLDRRLNQVDVAIEEAARRGKTTTALTAIEAQRKSRAALADQRQREGAALAGLKAERAALVASGRRIEIDTAPIRYVAELVGADKDSDWAIRWLIALMVLCCDSLAIALTAAASAWR
jgi:hypothetical protein